MNGIIVPGSPVDNGHHLRLNNQIDAAKFEVKARDLVSPIVMLIKIAS